MLRLVSLAVPALATQSTVNIAQVTSHGDIRWGPDDVIDNEDPEEMCGRICKKWEPCKGRKDPWGARVNPDNPKNRGHSCYTCLPARAPARGFLCDNLGDGDARCPPEGQPEPETSVQGQPCEEATTATTTTAGAVCDKMPQSCAKKLTGKKGSVTKFCNSCKKQKFKTKCGGCCDEKCTSALTQESNSWDPSQIIGGEDPIEMCHRICKRWKPCQDKKDWGARVNKNNPKNRGHKCYTCNTAGPMGGLQCDNLGETDPRCPPDSEPEPELSAQAQPCSTTTAAAPVCAAPADLPKACAKKLTGKKGSITKFCNSCKKQKFKSKCGGCCDVKCNGL